MPAVCTLFSRFHTFSGILLKMTKLKDFSTFSRRTVIFQCFLGFSGRAELGAAQGCHISVHSKFPDNFMTSHYIFFKVNIKALLIVLRDNSTTHQGYYINKFQPITKTFNLYQAKHKLKVLHPVLIPFVVYFECVCHEVLNENNNTHV